MSGVLLVGVLLILTSITHALPDPDTRFLEARIAQVAPLDLLPTEDEPLPEISKRDLEFNQYVPAYRLRGEPSCEELRAMWRLSKREARRATSTNNIPRSRPYSYGRLFAFTHNPYSPRQYVFGETRNFASNGHIGPVSGSFNRLRGMLGMGAGRPGSFQRVRNMVAAQRLPGETSKGKMEELKGIVLDSHRKNSMNKEKSPGSPSLSSDVYQPVRRAPSLSSAKYPAEGFTGPLFPGTPDWRSLKWNPQQLSCEDLRYAPCQTDQDCACAGQFRCSKNRCKVLSMHSGIPEVLLRKLLADAA